MGGWGWFFLILFLILLAYGGYCGWRFYSAKRQGLPPPPWKSYIPFMKSNTNSDTNYPAPRSTGPLDWIKDKIANLRNKRTARGAYEETGGAEHGTTAGRGRRGLEDDAWDSRVGNEDPYGGSSAYYNEEQELGLAPTPGYANELYGRGSDYLSASTNTGYAGASAQSQSQSKSHLDNPFGDENQAPSLRSVSPRPEIDTRKGHKRDNGSVDSAESSPTSVRKSAFREGI